MEISKFVLPFITFVMGLIAIPFVENLKMSSKVKQLKLDVAAELSDEFESLKKAIVTTDKSIKIRKKESPRFVHLSLAAPIDFLILEKNIIEIYRHLKPSQRTAYKRILDINRQINEKRALVLEKFNDDNWDCLRIEKSMLYEMLSLYYILLNLIESKENFTFPSKGNDQAVRDAAKALNVDYPY